MNPAIVIIPTTGAPELEAAVRSVLAQTVPTDVLVVFDGAQFARPLDLPPGLPHRERVRTLVLPFNTGGQRTARIPPEQRQHWYGARVMCAAGYLVNNDYAMMLDQDNWLRADHVESCIATLESRPQAPYGMAFALRTVHRKDGTFLCRDDAHSLGLYNGVCGPLIDTSCYFFRTDFLLKITHFWLWGWGGDRQFLLRVVQAHGSDCFAGTGRYTVCYRLGGNPGSASEASFVGGNAHVEALLNGRPKPWARE
ncbi:glycosyltransferase family A protein [Paraburkholderia acidisoli]|uniref:Glycosyltransferase 2-like domain-containing protein n=1 Tax=Paraburkholderia acidisoli TaxID=2571748 RepID=A0A7Z2JJZ6_9BURK|nr:glycosyltransferase family A protein [Paraburkholderia acidisoli]QGZ66788.1 hypothetical protein FAZ98_34185 [Paraburkholderia acidisoli]